MARIQGAKTVICPPVRVPIELHDKKPPYEGALRLLCQAIATRSGVDADDIIIEDPRWTQA